MFTDRQQVRNKTQAAALYAQVISCAGERFDWGAVNRAILERWSMSGLIDIKRQAWKLLS
jgi:hypothetical protein